MKNEEKSDTSADSSLHHDDDQQGIFSSESESDEDLIPPPPTKRKRSNQSVKSLGNTKSKRNSSHNKENSFVTPKRNEKSSAKNSDSQILTSLDFNIFDTPPSSTTKENPKRVLDEPLTEPVNADVQDDVYVQPHFRVQQISCSFSHSFFSFSIFYFFYVSFSTSLNNLLHRAAWSPRHNVICSFPMTLPSSLYHPFSFLRGHFFPCRFSLLIQS
ncbi:uncharacterized protein LOC124312617 [Daphnia pulicaria]|uniref:uncharacterized protein LOC124312617 n=1 Tax=Daphnia pulicaria TaxID=35523 RepID=UPI001EEB0515|nr:uncharacterized protein LOC124312617 [Daphnia pulicaria]